VIPPNELDSFRKDLVSTLRQYEGRLALDIGATALLGFADSLRTKRAIYKTALSDYSARGPSGPRPDALRRLNSHIDNLEVLVREAASLVDSFSGPARPGDLRGSREDLRALRDLMNEVKESIEGLTRSIDDTKKVLLRRPRGSASSDPTDGGTRSYRPGLIVGLNEHRRTGTTGAPDFF
jgi:hypothetical protein